MRRVRSTTPDWVPLETWTDAETGETYARIRWADGREEVRRVRVSATVTRERPDGERTERAVEVQVPCA